MCEKCERCRRSGYVETIKCSCGFCGKLVLTQWALNGGGILHGDYELIGDVVFHPRCSEIYLMPLNERTA